MPKMIGRMAPPKAAKPAAKPGFAMDAKSVLARAERMQRMEAGESRIAKARANAVRDYLVASGVDPNRIRTTHQPSGDHLADNRNPQGRHLNRRVEIEVYRILPIAKQTALPQQP